MLDEKIMYIFYSQAGGERKRKKIIRKRQRSIIKTADRAKRMYKGVC